MQTTPSGSVAHDSKSELTSSSWPPTLSFSFAQLAAFGHAESEGRTRCFFRAVAAFIGPSSDIRPPDRSASFEATPTKYLLLIYCPKVD
jgi:hypothetical protein